MSDDYKKRVARNIGPYDAGAPRRNPESTREAEMDRRLREFHNVVNGTAHPKGQPNWRINDHRGPVPEPADLMLPLTLKAYVPGQGRSNIPVRSGLVYALRESPGWTATEHDDGFYVHHKSQDGPLAYISGEQRPMLTRVGKEPPRSYYDDELAFMDTLAGFLFTDSR